MGDRNDADEEALLSPVDMRDAFDAARQSEHQLRTILDTIPTMVWSARPDGSAEFLNRHWLDHTGLSQAIDWGWTGAIHPDDRNRVVEYLEKDLPSVVGDRVQSQQLLLNLLLNAVEAMVPVLDRSRHLVIRSKRQDEDTALIERRDHGVGLKDPDKAFEAFFTTKENGMGMGLAICRSIVEAHHGRLWAACGDGPGTTFSFTLPLQPSVAP